MSVNAFPLLRGDSGVPDFPLGGRLLTVGQSKECGLNLIGKGIPDRAGHLLFRAGEYQAQAATPSSVFKVNGKIALEPVALRHGDLLEIGPHRYRYLEKPDAAPDTAKNSQAATWKDIAEALAQLLRDRDSEDFAALVSGVSRLFRCDAARMVEEDAQSEGRRTVARFPAQSGLERFSNRAIDWAKAAEGAVLTQEADWDAADPAQSLRTNAVSSVLCAALREQGRILGYLYLDRLRGAPPFTEADRDLCDALRPLFSEILARRGELRRQRETISRLQSASLEGKGALIYSSASMARLMELAAKAARTDVTVLIAGETGTGKELLSRFLHDHSSRSGKPFLALNCGAIPENLMESELFGHEKGAFTGADQRKGGLFQSAHLGTLLLDEIGELPPALQVKLLRVLQEGEVTPVGGSQPVKTNVRVIAASNRDLAKDVREGRFRQDLYFRLSVLKLELPPLREREQDVLLLAEYLLRKYALQFGMAPKSLSQAARNKLLAYAFPGNVRELENTVQKALLLSDGSQIAPEHIGWEADLGTEISSTFTLKGARQEAEKKAMAGALAKSGGNVSLAAKMLDVDRKWLMKLMEEAGLKADDYRGRGAS